MPAKMSLERIAKALTEALNADETTMHLALQTLQLGYTLGQQDSQKRNHSIILFFRRPVRKRFSLIFHREFQVCFVFLLFIQPDKLFRKCPQQLFLLAPGFRQ